VAADRQTRPPSTGPTAEVVAIAVAGAGIGVEDLPAGARALGLQRTYLARLIRDLGAAGARAGAAPPPDGEPLDEPADEDALPTATE
jgi:hypothetical protein